MESSIRVQIGVDRHQLFLQSDGANEVQEERFAGSIIANDETKGRATVSDALDVPHQSLDLSNPTNLYQVLTKSRNDSRT
jgi:hypothetical protein